MEEDIYRSQFRLPYSLYELLKASADENHRSVNAELIARLESTFKKMDVVRHSLGLPMTESEADQEEDREAQLRPFSGPSKEKLLASIEDPDKKITLSRQDLFSVIDRAIEEVLGGGGGAPQPSKGPRPRKIRPSR